MNEKYFALPIEQQQRIPDAAYQVFSKSSYIDEIDSLIVLQTQDGREKQCSALMNTETGRTPQF